MLRRPLCAGGFYGRSSPVSLCSLRGSLAALDSDVYWPAQLCCVWTLDPGPETDYQRPSDHRNCRCLHSSASSRPSPLFPHYDSVGCSCRCRVPSSGAVVTVYSEFCADYKRPNSTRNDATCSTTQPADGSLPIDLREVRDFLLVFRNNPASGTGPLSSYKLSAERMRPHATYRRA